VRGEGGGVWVWGEAHLSPGMNPAPVTAGLAACFASGCMGSTSLSRRCLAASFRSMRRLALFQRFLMALSVRPGSSFAISAHLLPLPCTRTIQAAH
jgi:hypothetical protein